MEKKRLGSMEGSLVIEPTFRKSCNTKVIQIPKFESMFDPLVITLWQLHERAAGASMNFDVKDPVDENML